MDEKKPAEAGFLLLRVQSVTSFEVVFGDVRSEREADQCKEAEEFHGVFLWLAGCYRISPGTRGLNRVATVTELLCYL